VIAAMLNAFCNAAFVLPATTTAVVTLFGIAALLALALLRLLQPFEPTRAPRTSIHRGPSRTFALLIAMAVVFAGGPVLVLTLVCANG
jgi:hypothetical protein